MEYHEPDSRESLRRGLRLLIARRDLRPDELETQVDALIQHADRGGLSLRRLLVASHDGEARVACLCVDAPGRTSSVFLPALEALDHDPRVIAPLVREIVRRAAARGVRLVQAMLDPEHAAQARAIGDAGFTWLARLLILERDLTAPLPRPHRPTGVQWVPYAPDRHALFARVVEGTYAGSLDCAALTGLRHIDDILDSHRATGKFLPELWQVGVAGDEPAGALLLADLPDQWACEVVYVGLLPRFRGRGLGTLLMHRAVDLSRDRGAGKLVLSVDERNHPARELYRRFGFTETGRRDAWIRILGCAEGARPHPADGSAHG